MKSVAGANAWFCSPIMASLQDFAAAPDGDMLTLSCGSSEMQVV